MSSTKIAYGAASALTVTGLNSLASAGFATSDAVDNQTDLYLDYLVEVLIADIVEAGNRQVVAYVISSVDGTNFSDNQSTNPTAMAMLGPVPLNGTGPWRSRAFSVAQAFGGVVPPEFKVVLQNDVGIGLAGSGNSVQIRGVYATQA
jgi:hypothetical protein